MPQVAPDTTHEYVLVQVDHLHQPADTPQSVGRGVEVGGAEPNTAVPKDDRG